MRRGTLKLSRYMHAYAYTCKRGMRCVQVAIVPAAAEILVYMYMTSRALLYDPPVFPLK